MCWTTTERGAPGRVRATALAGPATAVQILGVEQDERTHVTLRPREGGLWPGSGQVVAR